MYFQQCKRKRGIKSHKLFNFYIPFAGFSNYFKVYFNSMIQFERTQLAFFYLITELENFFSLKLIKFNSVRLDQKFLF